MSAATAAVVLVIAFLVQTQRAQTPIAPPALTVVPPGPPAAPITEREPVRPTELQQRDAVLARETLEQTITEVRATARAFNELCDTIDKRMAAEVDYYAERSRIQTGLQSEAARIQVYGIEARKAQNQECFETMKPTRFGISGTTTRPPPSASSWTTPSSGGAKEVRVYFNESGRKGNKRLDVLVVDDATGMAPNVLRAATAFGGSMCFDNRSGIGRYGIGMKGAALSMGQVLEITSWQEQGAFYTMELDIKDVGEDRGNVVNLASPEFRDQLQVEIVDILTGPMTFPKADAQERFVDDTLELVERLGPSGTIIYVPDCDRLTYHSARPLVEHATKEMARIYRRQLAQGLKLYVNNRKVEPFDPTYSLPMARHTRVDGLNEKFSRLYRSWKVPVPVQENDGAETKPVNVRLFVLPFEDWQKLPRKVLKNDLHVFDVFTISFMRSDREVHAGEMRAISGKHWTGDVWWRLEVEFPAELDEAFGVAVNKQGVRPKGYVLESIRKAIHEDLRKTAGAETAPGPPPPVMARLQKD